MMLRMALCLWIFVSLSRGGMGEAEHIQMVSSCREDLPRDFRHARITLRFEGCRELPAGEGDVLVQLIRRDGVWHEVAHTVAADYNERSQNELLVQDLRFEESPVALRGMLDVRIGADGARRGRAHFPTPDDVFSFEFSVNGQPGELLGYVPDRESFMPPWRKDTPVYGGLALTGTYAGLWEHDEARRSVTGRVHGAINYLPAVGQWGCSGNSWLTASSNGFEFTAWLPPERAVYGTEAWAEYPFPTEQDWSMYRELVLDVSSPVTRRDVVLSAGVQAGGFHHVRTAGYLDESRQEIVIPLSRFETDWRQPDWRAVRRLQLGFNNGFGVGTVRFRLHGVRLEGAPAARGDRRIKVVVAPEVIRSDNGSTDIPKGLFGFHDVGARNPAQASGQPDPLQYLAQLRPGLLRPLQHTMFNPADVKGLVQPGGAEDMLFLRAHAGDVKDQVIWCVTTDLWARPPWMEIGMDAMSERLTPYFERLASVAWVPGDSNNVLRRIEFWNEPFMWSRNINTGFRALPDVRQWEDSTQYGYLPGELGAMAWADLFLTAAAAARSVNPHLQLGGPSSAAFADNDYGSFYDYVRLILDRVHPQLDFITEHHYGGNPLSFAVSYEIVGTWCRVHYGRVIPIYNTEANLLGASSAGKALYNAADIFASLSVCPDKIRGRSLHAMWNGYLRDPGEEQVYRFLRSLRGTNLVCLSQSPRVLAVASTETRGVLNVVLLNVNRHATSVLLEGLGGFHVAEAELLQTKPSPADWDLRDTDGAVIPSPRSGDVSLRLLDPQQVNVEAVTLPGHAGVRLRLEREGYVPQQIRMMQQHDSSWLFQDVAPGQELETTVEIGDSSLVDEVWLRVVAGNVEPNEAYLEVNGQRHVLLDSRGGSGDLTVQRIPLTLAPGSQSVTILAGCREQAHADGYLLYMLSVETLVTQPLSSTR